MAFQCFSAALARTALTTVARYESILLDRIYAGKAMEGLIDLIVDKQRFTRAENILFLHTGGNVGLFGCVARVDRVLTRESCGGAGSEDVGGEGR